MLYLCATPIGNLQDVTLRVLEVLRRCDLVACEDTRHTRILLERHGITARLVSFHEHNEQQRSEAILPMLREGKDVAVVSDAGLPGLSDPGFTLVRACAAEGLEVTVLPGPSSVPMAVVLSGLPADRFAFVGFLARGRKKVVEQVASLEGTGCAVVAFESPRRLRASLETLGERWPDRLVAVCRELTKVHEEVVRGTAAEVLAALDERVRGEIVMVLEAWPREVGRAAVSFKAEVAAVGDVEGRVREALAELIGLGVGTKRAANVVARLTGLPGRRVYELGLQVKDSD